LKCVANYRLSSIDLSSAIFFINADFKPRYSTLAHSKYRKYAFPFPGILIFAIYGTFRVLIHAMPGNQGSCSACNLAAKAIFKRIVCVLTKRWRCWCVFFVHELYIST